MEENTVQNEVVKEQTFDDVLTNKEFQKEFDRRMSKAIETAKDKWTAEKEAERSEAEKLATMKAEEKLQYALNKEQEKSRDAVAELEAYKLKDATIKIASEKGLPPEFLDLIEFKGNNAEKISDLIENISKVYHEAVEKALNEKLKQPAPTQKLGSETKKYELPNVF